MIMSNLSWLALANIVFCFMHIILDMKLKKDYSGWVVALLGWSVAFSNS